MSTEEKLKKSRLIEALLDETSDIILICYLAYSGGRACLRDLFGSLRDADALAIDDVAYNLKMVRQKKGEAYRDPMRPVFERLMRLEEKAPKPTSEPLPSATANGSATVH